MITVLARFQVLPGKENVAQDSLRDMAAAVQVSEPGCLMYHVTRSLVNVDEIYLYEIYEDEKALQTHSETPHMQEFRKRMDEWSDRSAFNFETLGETAGFARVNTTVG